MRLGFSGAVSGALALSTLHLAGCADVIGLGDFKEGPAGAGGAGTTTTTSGASMTTTSGSGSTSVSSASSTTSSGPMCGDGMTTPPETCDGDCPVDCIDPDLCTSQEPTGDPAMCDVTCTFKPLVACKSYDGCCPSGCSFGNDNDCAQKILVLSGGQTATATQVKSALMTTGAFGTVDSINYQFNDPIALTLPQLTPYSAVLVYVFNSFSDPALVGDVLYDYMQQGGRVVLTAGANCADTFRIRGRFESNGMFLNDDGGVLGSATDVDPAFDEPMSPLLAGVSATNVIAHCELVPDAGTTVVAKYVDGTPFILRGKKNGKNRVDLNVLITSELSDTSVLRAVTNALKYPL